MQLNFLKNYKQEKLQRWNEILQLNFWKNYKQEKLQKMKWEHIFLEFFIMNEK